MFKIFQILANLNPFVFQTHGHALVMVISRIPKLKTNIVLNVLSIHSPKDKEAHQFKEKSGEILP